MEKVTKEDPVRHIWEADKDKPCIMWCDASSFSMGWCLQIDDHVVEDCAWLGKDATHINVAELEATIKGLNLALR